MSPLPVSSLPDLPDRSAFWRSFIRAVDAEPTETNTLLGASGFEHAALAVGVDRPNRRLVVISAEADARVAALAQADIQANTSSYKVVLARPAPVNLGHLAQAITTFLGRSTLVVDDLKHLEKMSQEEEQGIHNTLREILSAVVTPSVRPFLFASLNYLAAAKEIIQQLALISVENGTAHPTEITSTASGEHALSLNLRDLNVLDPAEVDRRVGICSVPLYEFAPDEFELFRSGKDVDGLREVLKLRNILQYFFPPPDHLALGLVERAQRSCAELTGDLVEVPGMGHPFGNSEILLADTPIHEVVEALQEKGLVAEGEMSVEITPKGQKYRSTIKFSPRESIFAKIARVLSIRVDINSKDLKSLFR